MGLTSSASENDLANAQLERKKGGAAEATPPSVHRDSTPEKARQLFQTFASSRSSS